MKIRWWVAIMLVAAVGLPAIGMVYPSIASAITTGVLTATFVAIFWYSVETRRLVDLQGRSGEFERHPWLKAADLSPEPSTVGRGTLSEGAHLWLPITNMGRVPALDVATVSAGKRSSPDRAKPIELEEKSGAITLVPGETLSLDVGSVASVAPQEEVEVRVTIDYRVPDGGRGRLRVGFRYTKEKGWRNLPTEYEFWLSDGSHFRS